MGEEAREDASRGGGDGAGTAGHAEEEETGANKNPAGTVPAGFLINLAIPTFASALTIIGPRRLATVFGMGTGVSTVVCSPEKARRAVEPARA